MRRLSQTALSGLMVIAVALLVACSTLGVPTPQTFNERAEAALHSAASARDTIGLLLDAHVITADDAQNVQDQVSNFRAGIDVARSVHAQTPAAGDARLQAAVTGLNALITYLNNRKAEHVP